MACHLLELAEDVCSETSCQDFIVLPNAKFISVLLVSLLNVIIHELSRCGEEMLGR